MTSPPKHVTIICPNCGTQYKDWFRSVNLDLDDFDEQYVDECSSAVCPKCKHKVYFETLVVKNGAFCIE
jgi:predicted nucleic-acid-binding Zn-ribbon protein